MTKRITRRALTLFLNLEATPTEEDSIGARRSWQFIIKLFDI
jgi:hypothetical protein